MKRKLLSVLLTFCLAFSLLPTAALADEAGEEGTAEGSGQKTYVAQIDDKQQYETLQAAINAATGNATVTLLADRTEDVTINKSIILDLGGKTLTNTNAGKATLTVVAGATATVKNGSIVGGTSFYTIQNNGTATFEDVTATAGNNGSSMIDNYGDLTINSGTYTGGLDTIKNESNAKLTITGGTFTLTKGTSKGFTGVVFNYGELNISGGEFIQSDKSAPYGQAQVIHTDKSGSSAPSTIITGGTFKNLCTKSTAWMVRVTNAAAGSTKVSGGTFNKSISDGYCADGFIPTKNADGTYGVKEGKYVAQIGSKKYETLADAIRLATKGKTVTLLADVTENVIITAAKDMILNLNGHTLSGGTTAGKAALTNYGKLTINDSSEAQTGTIRREDENTGGYYVIDNKGTMTINGGNVINDSSKNGSSLIRNGGAEDDNAYPTLNITGGTFTQQNFIAIKNDALSRLNVSGGKITSNASAIQNWYEATITGGEINGQLWTDAFAWPGGESTGNTTISENAKFNGEIVMDITGKNVVPKLNISGGDLNITNWRITPAASAVGAKPAVSGGTFSSEVLPEYCAPGFVPKANDDGTYGVEYKPIEVWTGYDGTKVASYKTIAEAAANLGENKWIVVAKDYTLTENFSFTDGIYLDVVSGATLTVAEGVTITVQANAKRLGVREGAALVNNGTIVVCGSSNKNGFAMLYGTFSGNALTVPEGCFLDNNGSNYFATANENALYEITYIDGTVKKTADRPHVDKNATQVKLLKDVEVGSWVLSNAADNFVLDLGGHTLSGSKSSGYYVLYAGVNMTIKNGTIKYNAGSEKGAICVYNGATVTIDSTATIDGDSGIGIMMQGETPSHVVLNGTVTTTGAYGFASNGSANSDGNPDTCNITVNAGATIKASKGFAIYHPTLGTVTINGGEITGHTGIEMCAGKLVVKDGTITSTGANKDETGSQNAILDGAAISIINRSYPGGVPTAEITGGTIKATGTGMTVKAYDYTGNTVAEWSNVSESVNISGGTFSSIPDNMNALCAAGYIPFKNADGTYGVTRPSSGSSGSYDPTYSVSTPSKTENGSVTVSPKSASKGDTVTVTVKPDSGYVLETLTVTDKNGNELTLKDKGNGKYTFTMPAGKVEVKATFMEDNSMLNFFYDVPNNAYFYEAVKWAVKNGITTGVGNDLFAPEQPCTRAQIVTFLWRAAGSPEPKGAASGMTDVVSGSYYEKAVAWAIENGITTGTTTSTFSPDATCTRAQAVTFLARALNAKAASAAEFSDVPTGSYFADAVAWAAANGVTEGIGGGLFGSDNDCTRGQIVTFLYRAYNK